MELILEIRPRCVLIRFSGDGTPDEVKAAFVEALDACESAGLKALLIDSRQSRVHPGFEAMRDLANFALALNASELPRTALIVQGSLQYGLARMFGSLVDHAKWEFRIFRETHDAEAWLEEN